MGEKTPSLSNLVEELRALEAKATKGKWIVEKEAIAGKVGISALHDNPKTRQFITWSMGAGPDADLIAAMRNALPTLLSALEGEKETEHDVEKAALAFAMYDGCGAQVNGTRVLCDDDRVSPEARVLNCICRRGMRKALAALKSPVKP